MSPRKKLADLIEADAPKAVAEMGKLDRGPGPESQITHIEIHETPADEPEESED